MKVLERYVFVSTSEIKAGKEQSDHDDTDWKKLCSYDIRYNCHLDFQGLQGKDVGKGRFPEKKLLFFFIVSKLPPNYQN